MVHRAQLPAALSPPRPSPRPFRGRIHHTRICPNGGRRPAAGRCIGMKRFCCWLTVDPVCFYHQFFVSLASFCWVRWSSTGSVGQFPVGLCGCCRGHCWAVTTRASGLDQYIYICDQRIVTIKVVLNVAIFQATHENSTHHPLPAAVQRIFGLRGTIGFATAAAVSSFDSTWVMIPHPNQTRTNRRRHPAACGSRIPVPASLLKAAIKANANFHPAFRDIKILIRPTVTPGKRYIRTTNYPHTVACPEHDVMASVIVNAQKHRRWATARRRSAAVHGLILRRLSTSL